MEKNIKKSARQLHDERQEEADRSLRLNSLEYMCQDGETIKSCSVRGATDASFKEPKAVNDKKISLAQAEKNVLLFIEKLIAENTAVICNSIFSNEIAEEFERQISELRNDKQEKNAVILDNMKRGFFKVDSGANFIEFKTNVSKLRAECIDEYKTVFEAEKLKAEKRKAIEVQICALGSVRSVIGETAYNNGVNALREQLAAI